MWLNLAWVLLEHAHSTGSMKIEFKALKQLFCMTLMQKVGRLFGGGGGKGRLWLNTGQQQQPKFVRQDQNKVQLPFILEEPRDHHHIPPLLPSMGKGKGGFYAVKKGRKIGVFESWAECQEQVNGFSGPIFQKFKDRQDAENFVNGKVGSNENHASSSKTSPSVIKTSSASSNATGKRKRVEEDGKKTDESKSVKISSGVRMIDVYTDGAASNNGKFGAQAGWGVHFPEHGELDESGRIAGKEQTNNRAELMGIIRAIQLNPDPKAQLRIHSDSQYSIKCLTEWQTKWRRDEWKTSKKEEVKNRDLIRLCEREMRKCEHRPILVKVKGHSTNKGNIKADQLAVLGATLPAIPESEWKDLEPPPSDGESSTDHWEKAKRMWEKSGFTREAAEKNAGKKSE